MVCQSKLKETIIDTIERQLKGSKIVIIHQAQNVTIRVQQWLYYKCQQENDMTHSTDDSVNMEDICWEQNKTDTIVENQPIVNNSTCWTIYHGKSEGLSNHSNWIATQDYLLVILQT